MRMNLLVVDEMPVTMQRVLYEAMHLGDDDPLVLRIEAVHSEDQAMQFVMNATVDCVVISFAGGAQDQLELINRISCHGCAVAVLTSETITPALANLARDYGADMLLPRSLQKHPLEKGVLRAWLVQHARREESKENIV